MTDGPAWRRYRRLWGPDPRRDVEDEFAFHVRERIDELMAAGMDELSAREEVERGFDDLERVKSTCYELARERQATMNRREHARVLWQDIVYGTRQMRAQPLLTFAALLTLAVGIGATTSIFSVVNAVLLSPLPYADSERIVYIWETYREFRNGRASPAHFRDWTEQSSSLQASAAWVSRNFNLTDAGEPERIPGASVTPGWFDVLYMPPAVGRYFRPGDDAEGARVAVLSWELWQRRFGGDEGIVGRDIRLNGEPFMVVGVTPAGYRIADYEEQLWTTLWIPPAERESYGSHGLVVLAKLKPGVTRAMAQADMDRITEGIRQRVPDAMQQRGVNVVPFWDLLIAGYRTQLLVLLGAVGLVLLLACTNVASLLLARATARRRELAIRAALGGGRSRLIRQLLTESVALAGAGGALGVALAWFGVRTLVASAPLGVPRIQDAGLDVDVLVFAVTATLMCGLLFGLAPALRATRTDLQSALRAGSRTVRGGGRDRLRSVLVVGEIGLALVLAVGAGLLIRSAQRVQSVPLGFSADGVSTARLSLPQERYGGNAATAAAFTRLLEDLRAQPGVTAAAFGTRVPLLGGSMDIGLTLRDFPREPDQIQIAHVRLVSDGYFETLSIPLVRGRLLQAFDMHAGAAPVVVMNETLARHAFGDAEPIGQFVTGWNNEGETVWREVVGVVGDVRSFGREAETPPELYFPYTHAPASAWGAFQRSIALLARTNGASDPITATRNAVRGVDPTLPLFDVRRMSDVVALNFAARRFNVLLLTLLGAAGLFLAAAGVYGVVGFFVLQRTQEIGVRMALGATRADVIRLVLVHGGRLTLLGILLGAAASYGLTRWLSSLLFEVNARDPLTFGSAAIVLAAAATMAALLPARRAARVEPLRSLTGS